MITYIVNVSFAEIKKPLSGLMKSKGLDLKVYFLKKSDNSKI